jgi:segregation and condensation protein A
VVYQVKLPVFEGPLDLLLHLIRSNEIDIYDIPIARITDEYFRYLHAMEELDLEVAGEFLVMAATLVYIKSRMLLPAHPAADGDVAEEDPRTPLVDMLLEYERCRAAAETLGERENRQRLFFFRSIPLEAPPGGGPLEVSLFDLLAAFRDVLQRVSDTPALILHPRPVTTAERMVAILDRLTTDGMMTFDALFAQAVSRVVVVVTFLALLELLRQGTIRVEQRIPFGEIVIVGAQA